MNELQVLNNEKQATMTSLELTKLINQFRMEEEEKGGKGYTEKLHKTIMRDIRKELKTMEELGIEGGGYNFVPSSFTDSQGKNQSCYEVTRDGALQILNKESTYVRVATIKHINKLEAKLKSQTPQLTEEEILTLKIIRAKDQGERALAVQDYGQYKHNQGIQEGFTVGKNNGIKEICNNGIITHKEIFKMIKETYPEEWSELLVEPKADGDWSHFLRVNGYLRTEAFLKVGSTSEYETRKAYQPTEKFAQLFEKYGFAIVKELEDERGKKKIVYTKRIKKLIETKSFKKSFFNYFGASFYCAGITEEELKRIQYRDSHGTSTSELAIANEGKKLLQRGSFTFPEMNNGNIIE